MVRAKASSKVLCIVYCGPSLWTKGKTFSMTFALIY
jgi:hypothetical protein